MEPVARASSSGALSTNDFRPQKRALVIGWVWPEPRSSAAGQHIVSLMEMLLRDGWEVTFASSASQTEHSHDLPALGIDTHPIKLNCSSFDDWVAELQPALVMFDRFLMEEQYGWRVDRACPQALKVLDTEDLQGLRQARKLAHQQGRRVQSEDFTNDVMKRELASIWRCDLSLIISEAEYLWLLDDIGVSPHLLHQIPFLLPTATEEEVLFSQRGFHERRDFATIGNFQHAPNWDAVQYLRELWPQIRRRLPEANLHIYGAHMPDKAKRLASESLGFYVHGRAECALQALSEARVQLAPLRFGAGLKGKLVDAARVNTPSVTTAIGIEGICNKSAWAGVVTEDSEAFIAQAVRLYENESAWQQASARCPSIRDRFSAEKHRPALLAKIDTLLCSLDAQRHSNFVGTVLQHHQFRSTEYFSRFLELKEKASKQRDISVKISAF